MKIILVHNFYQKPGGEDVVFQGEQQLLLEHGHRVVTYTRHNDELATLGNLALAGTTLWSRTAYRDLAQLCQAHQPDIVHFHNTLPLISPAAYYAARRSGAAVVQTLHNYRLMCPAATLLREGAVCEQCVGRTLAWPGIVHRCYRKSYASSAALAGMLATHRMLGTWSRQIDRYIALTPFARDKFIESGLPADKLALVPNFVVTPPAAVEPPRENIALYVGRLSSEKGIGILLDAWQHPDMTIPLRIIGDGPMADVVREAEQRDPRIQWLGQRHDVFEHMQRASMLILPSMWYEGFPMVVVEAMAAGLPIVASRLGSLCDVVEHERTGLLFTPGDVHDLVRQVQCLQGRPDRLAQMGGLARTAFAASYTPQQHYQHLMRVYGDARSTRGAPTRPGPFD